jgi:hypothetical protein
MSAKNKNKVVEQKIVPTTEVKPSEVKVEESVINRTSMAEKKQKAEEPKEESLHHKVEDINGRMVYETNAQYMEAEKAKGNI